MKRTALVVLGNTTARTRRSVVAAAERVAVPLVVFTGANGEAEQMRELWRTSSGVELVLEPAAATTAENASCTLPLLLERGVTDAVVVCAPLHVPRARWIFRRIYGRHGIAVRFVVARVLPTPGALVWELGALWMAPRQVRAELDRR